MFSLLPAPYYYDLYREFQLEIRLYRSAKFLLYGLGWVCFFTYIILLFGFEKRDAKYFLLDLSGLLLRFSGIILHKQFQIPKLFEYLLSEDPFLSRSAWKTIVAYRNEIMGRLLVNLYGRSFPLDHLSFQEADTKEYILYLKHQRWDWRHWAPIYFVFLFVLLGCFVHILLF